MIIAGYSKPGQVSIEKWEAKGSDLGFEQVWTSDIEAPSYIDYNDACLLAITASKDKALVHYFKVRGVGYEKTDEISLDTMGLCHISYLQKNQLVLASSYHDGALAVAKISQDKFEPDPVLIRHPLGNDGLSRIHCAIADGAEEYVYVTNIARDQIYVYQVMDRTLKESYVIDVKKGSGPRHLVLDEKRSKMYVMTEYSCELIVIDISGPSYDILGYYQTLPDDYEGVNDGGAIVMSKDQRFLYVSNRGHDSISCFQLEGDIKRTSIYTHTGHWPRHMDMVSDSLLGVANRRDHMVELIKRDPVTGQLLERVKTFDYVEPSFVR